MYSIIALKITMNISMHIAQAINVSKKGGGEEMKI